MKSTGAPKKDGGEALVGFRIGDAHCAVPLHLVREILKEGVLTPVPVADPSVLGVSDVRGEVLLVLDPVQLIGLQPKSASRGKRTRWLVLRIDGRHVAWRIDGATDVFTAYRSETGEAAAAHPASAWLSWVAKTGDELVFVLDTAMLTRSIERARSSVRPSGGGT